MAIVGDVNQSQIHAYELLPGVHAHAHVHENSDLNDHYVDANDVRLHGYVYGSEQGFSADG